MMNFLRKFFASGNTPPKLPNPEASSKVESTQSHFKQSTIIPSKPKKPAPVQPIQYVLWGVKKAHGQTPLKLKIGTKIPQKDQDFWKREGWTCVVLKQGELPTDLR